MADKRAGERRGSAHTDHAPSQCTGSLREIVGTEVRQFAALDVAPQQLGGIQLRRIAGQPLHAKPRALAVQVLPDAGALVRGQLVLDQDDPFPPTLPRQRGQERQHAVGIAGPGVGPEPQLPAALIPAKPQGHTDQYLLPIEVVNQDGCLSPRGPRPTDRRPLGDAAFVVEENPGLPAPGVFFTAGQRLAIQCWIATSLRSRARVAGRCSVHSRPRRMRQTWPGW